MKNGKNYRLAYVVLKLRRARGVPQRVLADDAGVDGTRLSAIENCRVIGPGNDLVIRIASALKLGDAERAELLQAAAHDRVMREMARNLPPERLRLLARCMDASRVLSQPDCEVLEDLVERLIGPREQLLPLPQGKEVTDT